MSFLERWLRRPRATWFWRANFQVHLWVGLLLTLYLIVIGLTGSILVFRVELERLSGIRPPLATEFKSPVADIERALQNSREAFPGLRVVSVLTPTSDDPVFITTMQGRGQRFKLQCDPLTGAVIGQVRTRRSWLNFVSDLHIYLLSGIRGRVANGVGGALLLLVNFTGLVVWWPGTKLWKRGLSVDLRRRWRRLNFDLHAAVGFWALSIISVWAISGIYFGWPKEMFAFVNAISPIVSATPPSVSAKPPENVIPVNLTTLVEKAYQLDPGTTFAGVNFPYSRRAPLEILMQRRGGPGREYTDTLYFNPWDGTHLRTWRYGVNESLGDWLIWLQVPLHFGTYWGFGVKVIWALLGLSIPVLAVTGVLMYWNRVLRHGKLKREPVTPTISAPYN